jgi:lytic murein transglycosylase
MIRPLLSVLAIALFAQGTLAAPCGGDFSRFIDAMAGEAIAAGVSRAVVSSVLSGVTPDPAVLAFDQRQRATFRRSFEDFVAVRVTPTRVRMGRTMLTRHAGLLSRIERRFGVPAPLLVAIWGLESDYGTGDTGRMPVPRTLATLAHDCRRTEMFQGELLAALRIIQRRDLSPDEMLGAWAGEIGQTQFLPSSYLKYGVDFDGDGRVDLRHSVPDVLASTANLIRTNGWRPGESWGEGTANFEVLREWNHADLYRRTLVVFAARLTEP